MKFREYSEENFDPKVATILKDVAAAGIQIADKLSKVELDSTGEYTTNTNKSGDNQAKLDIISDQIFADILSENENIYAFLSEEQEGPTQNSESGEYIIFFDPIDGSSNIKYNISVGSTFSIYKKDDSLGDPMLPKGTEQIAGGYIMYGSRTLLVMTDGQSVEGFTLIDGEFSHSLENIKIPENNIYSVNEAYYQKFPKFVQNYLDYVKTQKYKLRYVGTMVSDVHRTLIGGGVFILTEYEGKPTGALRLMYEVNPLSWMVQVAGGKSISGDKSPLEIVPEKYHQKVPLILGSKEQIAKFDLD